MYGSGKVGKNNYGVLETSAGSCAVVVLPISVVSTPIAFGDPRSRRREWTIRFENYFKDKDGDTALITRVITGVDAVVSCIESNDTLLGTVDAVNSINTDGEIDTLFEIGGANWVRYTTSLRCVEYT